MIHVGKLTALYLYEDQPIWSQVLALIECLHVDGIHLQASIDENRRITIVLPKECND